MVSASVARPPKLDLPTRRPLRQGGHDALEPRSRRPRSCSRQVDAETEAAILRLRQGLIGDGHDAGAQTRPPPGPPGPKAHAVATIWRILARHGLVTPQTHKRPRSSSPLPG